MTMYGKKKIISFIFTLVFFFISQSACFSGSAEEAFKDGVKYYKEGDFNASISAFHKAADTGIQNGKLFYNLGNAYLKTDDIGNAVLWYERSLRLIPDDPDLKFNYNYALSLIKDEKGDKPGPFVRILFFWKYSLSPEFIRWGALILNMIFWTMAAVKIIRRKRIFSTPEYIVFIMASILTFTAFYNYYESEHVRQAIVLPSEISVRSGLSDDSTELFVLHAGTKIRIEREKEDFYRIHFSDGKIGWIKKNEAGVI